MLVKTFAEACKVKGLDIKTVIGPLLNYPKEHRKAAIAQMKLFIICDVLNDGHKFDYDNYDEYKWFCWWYMDKPGFRLCGVRYDLSSAVVAPRLCFKSKALAEYAAEQFFKLFKDLYVQ